jgi:hypothetical protein
VWDLAASRWSTLPHMMERLLLFPNVMLGEEKETVCSLVDSSAVDLRSGV